MLNPQLAVHRIYLCIAWHHLFRSVRENTFILPVK